MTQSGGDSGLFHKLTNELWVFLEGGKDPFETNMLLEISGTFPNGQERFCHSASAEWAHQLVRSEFADHEWVQY